MAELIAEIARQHSIEDVGLAEDLYCVVRSKGSGLPTDDRMAKMAKFMSVRANKSEALMLLNLRKRKHVLTSLIQLPYFQALCIECAKEPHIAVNRMLTTFREISRKTQSAQCAACSLLGNCNFGKQYGSIVKDIKMVVDIDMATKIHADCPERPALDQLSALAAAIDKMQQLTPATPQGAAAVQNSGLAHQFEAAAADMDGLDFPDPDADSSPSDLDPEEMIENSVSLSGGLNAGGNAAHTNNDVESGTATASSYARINEQLVRDVSSGQLALFELGRQLATQLAKVTKGKYKSTPTVDERQRADTLRHSADAAQATGSEHALDDETFDAKVGKKTLQVRKYDKPEDKKFLLYGLVDVSISMNAQLRGSNYAMLTRGNVASTLVAALMHRVKKDEGLAFIRFFAMSPGRRYQAKNPAQFDDLIKQVIRQDYNGGGTSIISAVRTAIADIAAAKDEVAKCEILLVTDGDDRITAVEEQFIADSMKKYKIMFNVLDVNPNSGGAATSLKKVATKYLKADARSLTITNLVNLVK